MIFSFFRIIFSPPCFPLSVLEVFYTRPKLSRCQYGSRFSVYHGQRLFSTSYFRAMRHRGITRGILWDFHGQRHQHGYVVASPHSTLPIFTRRHLFPISPSLTLTSAPDRWKRQKFCPKSRYPLSTFAESTRRFRGFHQTRPLSHADPTIQEIAKIVFRKFADFCCNCPYGDPRQHDIIGTW